MTMGNGEARIPIPILTSVFEAVGNVEKTRFALSHRHWRSEEDEEVAASRRAALIGQKTARTKLRGWKRRRCDPGVVPLAFWSQVSKPWWWTPNETATQRIDSSDSTS